jgi:hypothetical protein
MSWRELLGLPPTRESFARDLIDQARRAGAADWRYDAREAVLTNGRNTAQRVNLANIFLEYRRAHRKMRPGLLRKYLALLTRSAEVPKLWTLAAGGIYPALRSRYGTMTVEIESRDSAKPFPPPVRQPWAEDVVKVLLYDFGPHMSLVSEHIADIWGAPREEIWARALSNLRSLARPRWEPLDSGVFRLVSEVAYEETFLLVDEVIDSLSFGAQAVFTIPNRGVLLAADSCNPAAVNAIIAESRSQMESGPWPLSGLIFERKSNGWRRYDPPKEIVPAAHALRTLDLARTYHEQKAALDKLHQRTGTDVFVASFAVSSHKETPDQFQSWCTWSSGVDSLLPKTEKVVLNPAPTSSKPDLLLVPWDTLEHHCGQYLKSTAEDPPRYRVSAFPSAREWQALQAVATGIKGARESA